MANELVTIMSFGNPATVIEVTDGDTIEFEVELGYRLKKQTTIRLLGVDTAETYGVDSDSIQYQTGMEHKQFVENWLNEADSLTVRVDEKGSFGRWLGEVFNEDRESLNDTLLNEFDVDY